jgi:hypothetical protein
MSLMKLIFAMLLLIAIVCVAPPTQAATVPQAIIAGSSAMWQTMALGAYNLACPSYKCAAVKGISAGHWTSASNVINLTDTRTSPTNVDAGTVWIVWNAGATKVWSFDKVDSVVGDRCYFAQPRCTMSGSTAAVLSGTGSNQIGSNLWGDGSSDTALPAAVLALFTNGTPVNTAATDIRPEDAAFAACRVNSALGAGSYGGAASDGLDGLGYNSANASGVCAASGLSQVHYLGTPIKSGYPKSTSQANVLSFNISGTDPITGTAIPAYTVVKVGATPIVFIDQRSTKLASLQNATDIQLQQAFSGKNCDASAFGLTAGGIGLYLREPLSGTYNTTEATVMRKPTIYTGTGGGPESGLSMETGVNGAVNNPLAGQAGTCTSSDGKGARYRGVGTSEEVKWVQNSQANIGLDGIGYTFFSYGNVSSIANNSSYGYITLNGVDPIFAKYSGGDPGQPGGGTLPAAANLPAACSGAFPCLESDIWTGKLSFPNLRNGTYGSWSIVRLISNGAGLTAVDGLVTHSKTFVVTSVPDFVPATKTVAGGITDPGLLYQRSHYQEYDGAGDLLGAVPVNSGTKEAGGDMGGCIVHSSGKGATTTQSVDADLPACVVRP